MTARGAVARFATLTPVVSRLARGRRVVGFDVFDTLVRRRVEPEYVKERVAVELARRLGRPADWPAMRARRAALEQTLWEERCASNDDGEFRLDELMTRWLAVEAVDAGTTSPNDVAAMLAYEMDLELRAVAPAPGVRHCLDVLTAAGLRLIFVSDMYLGEARVRALLEACGLGDCFGAGYVSCDHGRRKSTGRLFETVLTIEGIRPHDFLFIGNTRESDVDPPRQLGIAAVHLVDPPEHARRLCLGVAHWGAGRGEYGASHLVATVAETLPRHVRAERSPHYRLGLELAPAFVGLALRAIERARAEQLREVYFLSREGWLLLRLYRRLAACLGLAGRVPRGRYLFASRLSTFLPSMRGLSWADLERMWRQYPGQSLRLLLRNIDLPEADVLPLAAAVGLDDADRPLGTPDRDAPLEALLSSAPVQAVFARRHEASRATLRAYLEQIDVFGPGAVAMCDVGWKASIQMNLCRAFGEDPAYPEVHGLYLACAPVETLPRTTVEGYLADARSPHPLLDSLLRTPTPFEMTATAEHGTVVGYASRPARGGAVVPVLRTHAAEQAHASSLRDARSAVEDWAADLMDCQGLVDLSSDTLRPIAAERAVRYLHYPDADAERAFAGYTHVESFGVHGVTRFDPPPWRRVVLAAGGPREMWRALCGWAEGHIWPELALRGTRLPGALSLFSLRRALRAR